MNTGPDSGVTQLAPGGDTPAAPPERVSGTAARSPAADAFVALPPEGPQPPAYLLRSEPAPALTDDPLDAEQPTVVPAVLALAEAGGVGASPENLPLVVEAMLFAAEEPPTVSQLAVATNVSRDAIEEALDALAANADARGLRVQRDGSRARLVTAPEAAPFVQRLLGLDRPNKLSKPALETLAIIAYQQPVTRGAIERVRGVACDAPMATLRLRELIASVGQADTPGRPHLWATTPAFLDHFGLTTLAELPVLPGLPAPVAQGALDLDAAAISDHPADSLDESQTIEATAREALAPTEVSAGGDQPADAAANRAGTDVADAPIGLVADDASDLAGVTATPIRTPAATRPFEDDLGGLAAAGGD